MPKVSREPFLGHRKTSFGSHDTYPADSPSVAVLSGYGGCPCLQEGAVEQPSLVLFKNAMAFADGASEIVVPNGTHIKIIVVEANPPIVLATSTPNILSMSFRRW